MSKRALRKDFFVEIKKTRSRFISILLIVALGVAFFSGIRATSPDMRISADKFYDDSNLMDIRIISSLGITEDDISIIKNIDGVNEVMSSYSLDLICKTQDSDLCVKIMSNADTINKITVVDGRLPENSGECLVDTKFLESTNYKIGDTITLQSGTDDLITDSLVKQKYKIVGTGKTSYYLSYSRGTTSIGDGTINSFIVVPKEDFCMEVYTEAYLTVDDAIIKNCYSKEYEDLIDTVKEKIEGISLERCEIRYNDVYNSASAEIADAEQEIVDAEQKIADAEQEIIDAKQEISDAEIEISENENKLKKAQKKIDKNEDKLNSGKEELDKAKKELKEQKEELLSKEKELAKAKEDLEKQENTLDEKAILLKNNQEEFKQKKEILKADKETYKLYKDSLKEQKSQLNLAKTEINNARVTLNYLKEELLANEEIIVSSKEQLELAEQELNEKEEELLTGEEELASAKKKLKKNRKKLTNAKQELADAKKELEDGEKELAENKAENEPKIADAKIELAKAKEDLANLAFPEWYVLDRNSIQTYVEYDQDADRIKAIGNVFPIIFFLVAGLVSLTTMTRMVEEERTQIGTLKALGYSKLDISLKYILYALIASLLGSIIGIFAGQKILPVIIIKAYGILYNNLPTVMAPLNVEYSISSTLIAVLCTTLATLFACYKELFSVPAVLMRPVALKSGKRVLLERINFIWKRLNFSSKATVRNLVRYKKRFFMTIFGIGACMALLLVGFGVKDSIMTIGSKQFGEITVYDTVISFEKDLENEKVREIYNQTLTDEKIENSMLVKEVSVDIGFGNTEKSVYLFVPESLENLDNYIHLKNRITQDKYTLDDENVILSEKVAKLLNVKEGDTIYIKDGDTKKLEVKVSYITENYFQHYLYMSSNLYQKLYNKEIEYNEIIVNNIDNSDNVKTDIASRYLENDEISKVVFMSESADRISDMLKSMNVIIYVLVISAGLLAFIVLYNLNNINISERKRELATLKVLGFYDKEVSNYVFRENIWLTVIGSIIGVILGKFLHYFVIITAEIDLMMFGRIIRLESYIYSVLLTILFSLIVNFVMHNQLKKIDMVESMKSIE